MQQISFQYVFPGFEHGNILAVCILLLLVNAMLASISHIMVMLVGKSCLDMKLQIKTQVSLLDKVQDGVIIFCQNESRVLYANKAAQK